jgi:hypothetical protein
MPLEPADNAYFELPMVKKIIREYPNGADKRELAVDLLGNAADLIDEGAR